MQLAVHGCEEGYIPASTCAEVGLSVASLNQSKRNPYLNKGVCWDTPEEARVAGE